MALHRTQALDSSIETPDLANPGAEYDFRPEDFERIRQMIHRHAGIALSPAKRSMVYSRVVRRIRALGETSFTSYLERLNRGDSDEWQQFVNALTTNLTSFYREKHHFDILRDLLKQQGPSGKLRIWCCAASTGEEPYTIAFTAVEAFGTARPPVEIIATDIDTNVLARAAAAIYPIDSIAKIDTARASKFFLRGSGANQGLVRVRPEIAQLVSFRQLNLLDASWPIGHDFFAIFCRNVMIYFDKPTQKTILSRFSPLLSEHGVLFSGHSENLAHSRSEWESCGQTVYRPLRGTSRLRATASDAESHHA